MFFKFQLLYSLALALFIPTLFIINFLLLTLSIQFFSWVLLTYLKLLPWTLYWADYLTHYFLLWDFILFLYFEHIPCHLICPICCFCFYVYGMLVAFPNLGGAVSLGEFLCVPAVHSLLVTGAMYSRDALGVGCVGPSVLVGDYYGWFFRHAWPLVLGFPGGSESKESTWNTWNLGSVRTLGSSPGEGNGYPLQCYFLENSMDRGAWWTTVHGVTKSQTLLSN